MGFSVGAQTNPTTLHFTILQGDSLTFQLESNQVDPVLTFPSSNGYTTEMQNSGNIHDISYFSDEDFIGLDVFTYRSTISFFPIPSSELTTVFVEVIKSEVIPEDDFVLRSSDDDLELYPLVNDYSNTNSLELVGIAHTMHGSAVVTDSNTIIYTPGVESEDYIVYSVKDSLGTSKHATYYINKEQTPDLIEFEEFSISNLQKQIIILKAEDFTLNSSLELGTISQVANHVYLYTPNDESVGTENLSFVDSNGNSFECLISVFDGYVDEGVIRDDIVYTTKENEIIFNVFENDFDNGLVMVESSLDESLTYLGNGQISYIPPVDYIGVKSFEYSATNGFIEEMGSIDIVISNYNPVVAGTYEFDVKEGSVLSLGYQVPLPEYSFEILSPPSFGVLEVINTYDSLATNCGDIAGVLALVYSPFSGFEGTDEFDVNYCPDGGQNECQLIKTKIKVLENPDSDCDCISDCVWAGDANNDGKVNILDVLTIGRGIGFFGNSRIAEQGWKGESSDDWDTQTVLGNNHKFSDADGNGIVDVEDVDQVITNYDAIHSYAENNVLAVKNYPFFVIPHEYGVEPGELAKFDIIMGTEDYPVVDLQGIAFAINLSSSFVDSSTVKLEFITDGYFVKQSPFLNVVHQPVDGTIHAAGIRTNGLPSTGFGLIATLEFIVEEEAEGVKTPLRMRRILA